MIDFLPLRTRAAALLDRLRGPGTFEGGIYLPDMKAASLSEGVRPILAQENLRVPLDTAGPDDVRLLVAPGDRVLKGRTIAARRGPDGVAVHAPTSGRVRGLTKAKLPSRRIVPAVEIEPDGNDRWQESPAVEEPRGGAGIETIAELLAEAGVVDAYTRGPVHPRLRHAERRRVRTLIVSGMESEPYLSAEIAAMFDHPDEVVAGARHIARALNVRDTVLAVDEAYAGSLQPMRQLVKKAGMRWAPLVNKYPQSLPTLLVKALLGRETPPGGAPEDVRAAVFSVATARAVAAAVDRRRPQVSVCLTVSGEAVARPGNYWVPIGLPIVGLLRQAGLADDARRIIVGGPMTGTAIADLGTVVCKWVSGLLAMRSTPRAEAIACVRCGWCGQDCPVGLAPSELIGLVETRQYERARPFRPEACLDCGICTFECPSRLPLAESVRQLNDYLASGPAAATQAVSGGSR